MYTNAGYTYQQNQQMQQMQMHQRQQMQMQQQRQMQIQQQQRMQQQQQMQNQQHQQQIYQARKQQVREKQQKKLKHESEENDDDDDDEEYDDDDDDDDDDDEEDDNEEYGEDEEDDGDDDESLSSISESLSSSESATSSGVVDTKRVAFDSEPKSKSRSKTMPIKESSKSKSNSRSKSTPKSKTKSKVEKAEKAKRKKEEEAEEAAEVQVGEKEAAPGADANIMADQMQKLTMANHAGPAQIPSSALSPGEYMFNVISDVLSTNNKKNFQRILARTPLPIALRYLHQIAQRAFATGNKDIHKVVIDTNKKYNIVSDVYIDAFAKGESKAIYNAMIYLGKTVQAFNTAGTDINTDELLKFFTPEFIAMNLIQSGNIEAYDRVMTEFKNEEIRISRGFHVAKALIAAYTGVPKFFSNQKRYTFTREIVILAICGGSTETLDYVMKKTKMAKMSHDIVLEARSCQPIPANMMKHLAEKYNVSEMSL